MAHDPIEFVVSKMRAGGYDPRETSPNQWKARCPGHKGTSQKLSVKGADDGRLLLHCHHVDQNGGGCTWYEILLEELTTVAGDKAAAGRSWPTSVRCLSTCLRRVAPRLRAIGITIDFDRSHDRLVTINVTPKPADSSVDSVDSDAKAPPD